MGMLEERGLYDPYDDGYQGLDSEAGRMWRECRDLRQWRKNMGWEYYDKGPSPNRWLVIGGVLVVTEAFSAIILRFTALLLIALTVLVCVYVDRRSERMMQTKLNADPLLQRSQQIINATKAYAVLLDHYNAWFRAYPDDTERLDRVCAFLARAQAALVRKTTNFNAFIKMMETKRYVESNPGDRVALAELTAEPDQILALASECGLSDPDEVLLTDQELLDIEHELNEALYGPVPPLALPGTRT